MNFKMKTLAVALALASSASAHAGLDAYNTGDGELYFNVYDTISHVSFTMDLPSVTGYSQFGSFHLSEFLPGNFNNAQGLTGLTAGTAVTGALGVTADGRSQAEQSDLNINWTLNGATATAWQSFVTAAGSSANWKWNVVAGDSSNTLGGASGTATTRDAVRYLSTVSNSVALPFNQTSANFSQMSTANINLSGAADADPMYFASAADPLRFENAFGANWKTRFVDSTGKVGDSLNFFYLTGRSTTAINEQFENDAKWTFNVDAAGVGTLNYATATAPVPEADTWAMLLAGLGLMGFIARRRTAV